jgi:ribosome biogenesis protein UTP30
MTAKASSASSSTPTMSQKSENAVASFVKTGLDTNLVDKAVGAILKYHEKVAEESTEKLSLLGNERPVQVQFTLLRAPGQSRPKPVQIMVPHPFFKLADSAANHDEMEEPEICLIVKESSKPWCQEMIERFPDHMGGVKKVLTLDSLRKKYTSYEQKRELLHKYNVFMADDRILPMLSKSLGKAFIKTKRLPVPICLTRENALPFAIQKALSATYMTINTGTCITIRAGHTGMEPQKLVENVAAIVEAAVPKMPRQWANVQLIGVKTADSVSLPIYNKTPEVLREIAKMAGLKESSTKATGESKIAGDKKEDKDNSKESKSKKKREIKSPLLQALKKQRREEEEEKKSKRQKKETENNDAKAVAEEKPENHPSVKQTSKRKSSDPSKDPVPETTKVMSSKKRDSKKEVDQNKEEVDDSPKKKQKKEEKKPKKKLEADANSDENRGNEKSEFIEAKKFKGSKKGYVFRKGKQGLGYYVDIKPVVDRAAIEAIMRMGKNQNRRGGQKKNKYKGTRKF